MLKRCICKTASTIFESQVKCNDTGCYAVCIRS